MKALTPTRKIGQPAKYGEPMTGYLGVQLPIDMLNRIDLARGSMPRAEWVRKVVAEALK